MGISTEASGYGTLGELGHCMYRNEQALVDGFLTHLGSSEEPWRVAGFTREFEYGAGRTDVVAADEKGRVLAFEAKLQCWRNALTQAHRNRCFAHRSYVVLPESTAFRALRFEAEFRRRGVGICLVSDAGLIELLRSAADAPCLDWLCSRARAAIREDVMARVTK